MISAQAEEALARFVRDFAEAWNQHDVERLARCWFPDGDLLNTRGHLARGRDAVLRLLAEEHSGPLKHTEVSFDITGVRAVGEDTVFVDATQQLRGVRTPDGTELPTLRLHVAFIARWEDQRWGYLAVRPYSFLSGF
jgi:uncharacterized protein (TIGR02246 family)